MATNKELKNRIKSVKDTQKITNAMYLISSNKMNKARRDLEVTRPFFRLLENEIRRMFAANKAVDSPYFAGGNRKIREDSKAGYLVFTSDKGLAGSYNSTVVKKAVSVIGEDKENALIFNVGEYGRRMLASRGYKFDEKFEFPVLAPDMERARNMCARILELYEKGDIKSITVIYTEFANSITGGSAVATELLPFERHRFIPDEEERKRLLKEDIDFVPSVEKVLESSIQTYLAGYIYSVIADSYTAEQNARMVAMEAANKNADEILDELNMEYNHVRQGAITQEITEISSGAKSLRKNK